MKFDLKLIKELRKQTGVGYLDCKKSLYKTNGDMIKALDLLKEKGLATVEKKLNRLTNEGIIGNYVHGEKIGVMVEVSCETEFAASTQVVRDLVRDLAMHVASMNPLHISMDNVNDEPKSSDESNCLMSQIHYKSGNKTVQDIVDEHIVRIGENITVERFIRYEVGEMYE